MSLPLNQGLWRRRQVRPVRQTELAECGLACLAMVANYHGLEIQLAALRQKFPPSIRGVNIKTIIAIADKMNLSARAVKVPLNRLGEIELPAILHWDFSHFVVLERIGKTKALIHDPDGRSRWLEIDNVSRHYTGVALEVRPMTTFSPGVERSSLKISQLWTKIRGFRRSLSQILVLSILMQVFVLVSPYYMQVAIDTALPALDLHLLSVLAIGFGLFAIINAIASFLRGMILLNAGSSTGFGLASNLANHLFRLPIEWFERRHMGDILSRFQSVTPIQNFLTEGAVAGLVDGSLAIVTLIVMFFYSGLLTTIALTAFVLYILTRALTFKVQREAQEAAIIARGVEQTNLIESMRGMSALRLMNRGSMRYSLWQSKLADSLNATIQVGRVTVWQQTANALLFSVEMILSTYVAVSAVVGGGFSVGMVFAFMAYKLQFLEKGRSLIDQAVAFRMLALHLDRLSDIGLSEEDVSFRTDRANQAGLQGAIELRNVSYRYSPTDPWVLENVTMSVRPGEHVAITGPSGAGKSTLAKILLGLVEPTNGELLIDGIPIEIFGYQNYHDQIGAVLQDDGLFLGTIADNICLFDETVRWGRLKRSAEAAAIREDIERMPMQYQTFVGNMGSTLSGGQKQRVMLARALYRQPRLLVMDEGTAHLDTKHERRVLESLSNLGITRIVIAHRKETVAAASRVFDVQEGRLVELNIAS